MRSLNELFLAVLLAAAPAGAKVLEDIVASVNGKPLMLSEYRQSLGMELNRLRAAMPDAAEDPELVGELRKKVLDDMVNTELLAQRAEELKLKTTERELDNAVAEIKARFKREPGGRELTDEEVEKAFTAQLEREGLTLASYRERIRRRLLVQKLIQERIQPKAEAPTEAQIRAFHSKLEFVVKGDTSTLEGVSPLETQAMLQLAANLAAAGAERIRARHILLRVAPDASIVEKSQALKTAKGLRKRLADGEDFDELARKHSQDVESAKRGGDLGYMPKGFMLESFDKAAFALAVGELSQPVETEFGYHLIRVDEKKAARKVTFEDVQEELGRAMHELRAHQELERTVKELREKAKIDVRTPVEKVSLK